MLVKTRGYWVAFDEFGKYVKTDPYISSHEVREEIVREAIARACNLAGKLFVNELP